jgi:hypothetical protein
VTSPAATRAALRNPVGTHVEVGRGLVAGALGDPGIPLLERLREVAA